MAFLFIWQLTFSAPLSIASGCIGLAQYAGFLFPSLTTTYWQADLHWLNASITVTPATFVAMGTCLLAVFLLYRNVTIIGRTDRPARNAWRCSHTPRMKMGKPINPGAHIPIRAAPTIIHLSARREGVTPCDPFVPADRRSR